MDENKIILKALECIYGWIDNRDREPDKAMILHSKLKGHIKNLEEEIGYSKRWENDAGRGR